MFRSSCNLLMLSIPPDLLLLFSDIDECALVNNNCTKSGADCTNTLGSFNCTCQTQYFWNGIECEGLFSVPLVDKIFKPIRNSHPFVFLCVHMFVILHAFLLKRWNRPLPSSRTALIWCRNYGVRRRLSVKSPSSAYRTKSRAGENEQKFLEIRCWRVKNYSWERSI